MKTTVTKIECDSCGSDISPKTTGYPNNYILKVSCVDIEVHNGGAVFSCLIHPPINNDLYFCGLACMTNYKNKP